MFDGQNKGGGSGGGGNALNSIDFPTPDATNVYDIIDHLGVAYQNQPEVVGGAQSRGRRPWTETMFPTCGERPLEPIRSGGSFENTAPMSPALSLAMSSFCGQLAGSGTGALRGWAHLGNPRGVGRWSVRQTLTEANNHVTAIERCFSLR